MTTPLMDELKAKDLRYQEMVGKLERVRIALNAMLDANGKQQEVIARTLAQDALTLLSEIMKDE
mgnify:CR=1